MNSDKRMNKKLFIALGILGIGALLAAVGFSAPRAGLRGAASGVSVTPKTIRLAVLKNIDDRGERFAQVGTGAVEGLLDALERYGARVEMAEVEKEGVSVLKLKVDGVNISPIIVACPSCEPIVFEY